MAKLNINFNEIAERYNKYWMVFIFLISLEIGNNCTRYFIDAEQWRTSVFQWIDHFIDGACIIWLVWLVWNLFRLVGNSAKAKPTFWGSEFYHSIFMKSLMISWFVTWPALMLLGELTEKEFFWFGSLPESAVFPATFYLNAALFVMLFVHAVAYFLLSFGSGADDDA